MHDYGDPGSYFTIARGVPVVTSDGVEIGRVKRVLVVQAKNIFDGIVVRTGDGDRFVDAPEIGRIYERAVLLTIDAEEAAGLPRPGESPTAGPAPIGRRLQRGVRRRLRRLR
jgi:sporulation protein YlmC with PRC-barrel domain